MSLLAATGKGSEVGSFNFNLHAKCSNADRVADGVGKILAAEGWRSSKSPPDERSRRWGGSSNRRAFWISQPVCGWTSILDSDVASAMSLAPPLAAELDVHTLFCMVNDSDSWMYSLADRSGTVDEFDSANVAADASEFVDGSSELVSRLADIQTQLADSGFKQRIADLQNQIVAEAPPEIQEIHAQVTSGNFNVENIQQYNEWLMNQAPRLSSLMQEFVGSFLESQWAAVPSAKSKAKKKRKSKSAKSKRAAVQAQIDKIRPLLVADAADDQVAEVLHTKAIFAEEMLAKFLPLVGIPPFYAYLDYDHKDEASPEELSAQGIEFAHHLMFELPSA
jgi:hypothetical protein